MAWHGATKFDWGYRIWVGEYPHRSFDVIRRGRTWDLVERTPVPVLRLQGLRTKAIAIAEAQKMAE